MRRVRVTAPDGRTAEADGATVLRAVRVAVAELAGRKPSGLELTRVDSHTWTVAAQGLGRYTATEARSGGGARGAGTRVVSLSLPEDALEALDDLALDAGISRSAAVVALVRAAPAGLGPDDGSRFAGSSKIATSTLPSMCKGAGSAFGEG